MGETLSVRGYGTLDSNMNTFRFCQEQGFSSVGDYEITANNKVAAFVGGGEGWTTFAGDFEVFVFESIECCE